MNQPAAVRKVIEIKPYADPEAKVYPRSISGIYARWRWVFVWLTQGIFYGLCWIPWHGRQAILFDIETRKFYIFDLVLWPQDTIYLALLLIIGALALFLFTAVAGRLWCGYACPQTVYTEIFLWFEKLIEGERPQRMKLDAAPWSARKLSIKTAKHATWLALSLWTGFTFVGYFTPIRELAHDLLALSPGAWSAFWVLFYGFATYGNAGFLREQMCRQICPYARFQFVMFDPDTLIIAYDAKRGRRARAARQGCRSAPGEARRLRGLQHLRPGLPDRHRHPQRPAERVHRLCRLHRRLRPGDGQDGLSARPDPLLHRKRRQQAPHRDGYSAAGIPSAGDHLRRRSDLARGSYRLVPVRRASR